MPTPALSHDACIAKLCLICLRKQNLRNISASLLSTIKTSIFPDYNPSLHPNGICSTCRLKVSKIGSSGDSGREELTFPDFASLISSSPITRSSPSCDCFCCKVGRMDALEYARYLRDRNGKASDSQDPSKMTLCKSCLSEIGRGKPHHCNRTSKLNNIADILNSCDEKMKEQVCSMLLDSLCLASDTDRRSGTLSLSTRQEDHHFRTS